MDSTYSTSSLAGLVSSKRRWQTPPILLGEAEVQADRLGVADVQVAVGLRGEPRHDAPAVLVASARSCATMSRMKSLGTLGFTVVIVVAPLLG